MMSGSAPFFRELELAEVVSVNGELDWDVLTQDHTRPLQMLGPRVEIMCSPFLGFRVPQVPRCLGSGPDMAVGASVHRRAQQGLG